ncbi:MAG: cyclic nucleotide-binding domain-containing protein [Acidobacteriota bacterium]
MEDLHRILVTHPFLEGLQPAFLDLITGCASNVKFNAGEFLFREGEEANQFYIVRQGRVAVQVFGAESGPLTIQTVGDGEVLGWSWLVPPFFWHFDAQALDLTRAIALDGKCLRTKCEHDHDLGYELLKRFSVVMVQRLEATRLQLLDLYGVRK